MAAARRRRTLTGDDESYFVAMTDLMIGLLFIVAGTYAGVLRYTKGLGGSTNLSDSFPWGLWVGFDILCGVGLAAGGFPMSAMVHTLRLEKYRPLARPTVLTAFIGSLLVVGGLMFDLGHPWRIWHPIVMWNPHSVMFEIAWCVTTYTLVLAAEGACEVVDDVFKTLTVHAKHLVEFTDADAGSSFIVGRSLSISKERPRCSRERTVPTAQLRTSAVSA